jgi:hypothetical protein
MRQDMHSDMAIARMDQRRGHRFQPPAKDLKKIPALYATENTPLHQKYVYLHYFVGPCDWWITELDSNSWEAFGYVNLGNPEYAEWGYIDLTELGQETIPVGVNGRKVPFPVERDCWWTITQVKNIDGINVYETRT